MDWTLVVLVSAAVALTIGAPTGWFAARRAVRNYRPLDEPDNAPRPETDDVDEALPVIASPKPEVVSRIRAGEPVKVAQKRGWTATAYAAERASEENQ